MPPPLGCDGGFLYTVGKPCAEGAIVGDALAGRRLERFRTDAVVDDSYGVALREGQRRQAVAQGAQSFRQPSGGQRTDPPYPTCA